MKLTGCIGIREGFQFQYQNLVGEGRVTEEALQALQPAMEQAVKAVRAIRSEGFSKAHLSKDGTPESLGKAPGSVGRCLERYRRCGGVYRHRRVVFRGQGDF